MKHLVIELVNKAVTKYTGADISLDFDVTFPNPEFGDLASNVALLLVKKHSFFMGQNPQELSVKLSEDISLLDENSYFQKVEAKNGFINFRLSSKVLLENLKNILSSPETFPGLSIGRGKTVVIEYFQNNVAKPPHVGHLRSAVIGDSLTRLYKALGYKVITDTHIGDWGTQFGILLLAYKTFGNKAQVSTDPINELNKLYVEMNAQIKTDESLYEKAKAEFKKLEDGDPENRELWQWFVTESMSDFHRYCDLLKLLPFDYNLGESFYEDKMPGVISLLKEKKLITTGQTGELYVDLESLGLGRAILVKSDGATTYLLRDLATYIHRKTHWNFTQNLYVVDSRQSHHFRQLFKVLELVGYPVGQSSRHVEFGFMSLPSGAISTREGNIISLNHLISEAEAKSFEIILEKNPELPNKREVAEKVARSAIKYFDLSHNRKSEIVFTWDKAISFEGNTGPYLQYAFARIHGILEKVGVSWNEVTFQTTEKLEFSQQELNVLRKLMTYPTVLENSAKECLPNLICAYLFELAQVFNNFYENSPVASEAVPEKKQFRLEILKSVGIVLQNGLYLLGIEVAEEM